MTEPVASRPYMPGYGTLGPDEGSGLLPWSWAEERLRRPRNFWVGTVRPDRRPHSMPVWGMWNDGMFWLSSSNGSSKARNLRADPRCVVTTEDANDPVVLEGTAELVVDPAILDQVIAWENEKYGTDYRVEILDPAVNSCFRIRPTWAFALRHDDFEGSPTRWSFEP